MLGLGPDRTVLGHRVPGRLRIAGADPPRPRHPRRVWPAQKRNREIARPRPADAGERHWGGGDVCDGGPGVGAHLEVRARLKGPGDFETRYLGWRSSDFDSTLSDRLLVVSHRSVASRNGVARHPGEYP